MKHFSIRLFLFFFLAKGLVVPAECVTGSLNGIVMLPCTYSAQKTTMCWGLGQCPTSGCNSEIIKTDGEKVIWRKSNKYQLLGHIAQGNVSLTITRATKEDEGIYCCRVEIHGLFNDQKIERILKIQEAAPSHPEPPDQPLHTTHRIDSPYVTPKTTSIDSVPSTVKQESQDIKIEDTIKVDNKLHHIIATVVILIIVLLSLAALLFSYRHRKRKNKDTAKGLAVLSLEGLERTQDQTEQNIYTIN
ncbi:hepatitis A virus cellular receptor 1 homolog [Bufo bufo]|uniref:hepatitis A virus cellular receptor 1 homolog n=1 Tax=Bufo bufo TaxID=8384 RepID=UPI001ABEB50C|nr:hepatitis A virus cellular receptor 1 homolog [Bufo bufo]